MTSGEEVHDSVAQMKHSADTLKAIAQGCYRVNYGQGDDLSSEQVRDAVRAEVDSAEGAPRFEDHHWYGARLVVLPHVQLPDTFR